MNIFPFQLDHAFAFYIVVYVLTLVVHAVFMTYVLAGSIYLAWAAAFPGSTVPVRSKTPLAGLLRDWMPFALSAAITAGVAPLLFVQIIYRQEFYTSNLLLGWRWMTVVPVLIIGFYLLYVLKSKIVSQWSLPARTVLAAGVAGSFLFVAFCWTTNHLLGLEQNRWPDVYASGEVIASLPNLALRLLTWVAGAFPSLCSLAAWQLAFYAGLDARENSAENNEHFTSDIRRLAKISLGGLMLAVIFGSSYVTTLDESVQSQLTNSGALWVVLVVGGIACQVVGWTRQLKQLQLTTFLKSLVTAGNVLALTGVAFLREIIRVAHVNHTIAATSAQSASEVGGFGLFIGFTILNICLITFCIRLVTQRTVR